MSDASNHTSFTAADIERYYRGDMSAEERHAMEKAALDDPFLADALEGYAATATPEADVTNIQKRLNEKLKKGKLVPVFSTKYEWLQIAALLLLLAGAGWLVFRFNFTNKNEIAIAAPPTQKQPAKLERAKPNDSVSKLKTIDPETNEVQALKKSNAIARTQKIKTSERLRRNRSTIQKQREDKAVTTQTNNLQRNETAAISGYISPADASPSTMQKRSFTQQNRSAVAYKNSNMINDSTSGIAAAQGIKTIEASTDSIHLNLAMQPSHKSLNEVVVVHLNAKKRATAKPSVQFEELEPAEGWTNFNEYIAENLKEPEHIKEKTASGDVELSFEINKEGEAVNIKVEKSLCSKCDEEAVRLLKEGPKWKKKKDKIGKVIIHF